MRYARARGLSVEPCAASAAIAANVDDPDDDPDGVGYPLAKDLRAGKYAQQD